MLNVECSYSQRKAYKIVVENTICFPALGSYLLKLVLFLLLDLFLEHPHNIWRVAQRDSLLKENIPGETRSVSHPSR